MGPSEKQRVNQFDLEGLDQRYFQTTGCVYNWKRRRKLKRPWNYDNESTPHAQPANHAITPGFLLLYNPPCLHHMTSLPPLLISNFLPLTSTTSPQDQKMAHLSIFFLSFFYFLSSNPGFVFSSPVQDPDLVVQEVHR